MLCHASQMRASGFDSVSGADQDGIYLYGYTMLQPLLLRHWMSCSCLTSTTVDLHTHAAHDPYNLLLLVGLTKGSNRHLNLLYIQELDFPVCYKL